MYLDTPLKDWGPQGMAEASLYMAAGNSAPDIPQSWYALLQLRVTYILLKANNDNTNSEVRE